MQSVQGDHAELIRSARALSNGDLPLVLTFADYRYRAVLLNWLAALSLQRVENYLVIALDSQLYFYLQRRGVPVVLSELTGDLGALWMRRISVFSALCNAGVNFVHSDADAVWLGDPRRAHLSNADADLVVSQGSVWPADCFSRSGFVLCCGLFALGNSEPSRRLLADLATHVRLTADDQVSLNRLVARRQTQWTYVPGDDYRLEFEGAKLLCSRSPIRGVGSDGLRISVLPHHLFQRIPVLSAAQPMVLHPLSPKEPEAKLRLFAQLGCLILRPDWDRIEFDATTLDRLCA